MNKITKKQRRNMKRKTRKTRQVKKSRKVRGQKGGALFGLFKTKQEKTQKKIDDFEKNHTLIQNISELNKDTEYFKLDRDTGESMSYGNYIETISDSILDSDQDKSIIKCKIYFEKKKNYDLGKVDDEEKCKDMDISKFNIYSKNTTEGGKRKTKKVVKRKTRRVKKTRRKTRKTRKSRRG